MLSREHPRVLVYRSAEPVLVPELPAERSGTVANVVFPTGIDRRDDLGPPERFNVYYGMADDRIGAARLEVPDHLPTVGASARRRQQGQEERHHDSYRSQAGPAQGPTRRTT